jgi:DNA-binding beta-propeller fold protein YncE
MMRDGGRDVAAIAGTAQKPFSSPAGVAVNPNPGGDVYVTNGGSNTVSVLSR